MTKKEKAKIFKAIDDYVSQQKLSDCSLNEYFQVREFAEIVKGLIDSATESGKPRIGVDISSQL